jgi:hypothetical protein
MIPVIDTNSQMFPKKDLRISQHRETSNSNKGGAKKSINMRIGTSPHCASEYAKRRTSNVKIIRSEMKKNSTRPTYVTITTAGRETAPTGQNKRVRTG